MHNPRQTARQGAGTKDILILLDMGHVLGNVGINKISQDEKKQLTELVRPLTRIGIDLTQNIKPEENKPALEKAEILSQVIKTLKEKKIDSQAKFLLESNSSELSKRIPVQLEKQIEQAAKLNSLVNERITWLQSLYKNRVELIRQRLEELKQPQPSEAKLKDIDNKLEIIDKDLNSKKKEVLKDVSTFKNEIANLEREIADSKKSIEKVITTADLAARSAEPQLTQVEITKINQLRSGEGEISAETTLGHK